MPRRMVGKAGNGSPVEGSALGTVGVLLGAVGVLVGTGVAMLAAVAVVKLPKSPCISC